MENCQEHQKQSIRATMERLPFGTNQIPRGLPSSAQVFSKGQKQPNWVIFKGGSSLDTLSGYESDSSCSGNLTCQGTLWNQSEAMKSEKSVTLSVPIISVTRLMSPLKIFSFWLFLTVVYSTNSSFKVLIVFDCFHKKSRTP